LLYIGEMIVQIDWLAYFQNGFVQPPTIIGEYLTGFTLVEGQGLKAQLGPLVLWQIHADSKTFGALTRTFQQVPISTRKDVYLTPVVTELVSKMKCPGEYTKIWVVTFLFNDSWVLIQHFVKQLRWFDTVDGRSPAAVDR